MTDEESTTPADRLVYEAREKMWYAREMYNDQGVDGYASEETHKLLASKLLNYQDALLEHRDEKVLDHEWPDVVDEIRRRRGETVEVERSGAGRTNCSVSITRPAVLEIPVEEIVAATHKLDDIAKDLGFGSGVRDQTPHNEVSHKDLRALVSTRGQSDAEEALPDGGEQ